jgi:hypothetical protein
MRLALLKHVCRRVAEPVCVKRKKERKKDVGKREGKRETRQ